MQLSIIIVNYNVAAFLEKCLQSVVRATQDLSCEIWVVDNCSVDQSVHMVRKKFPFVKLIENQDNVGFSKANNQALTQTKGEYVLLLNPDTIVSEDCFEKCILFMDKHPDAGALGVKMLDGSGNYLPESKRGFPSPWTSLSKMIGLNEIFPKSKFWNGYYLGHLSNENVQKVDVLTGAYMFMRRKVLNEVGLLDESFFMYGEDIDLSYRIKKGGYEIYYYPDTTILHYKGESTKKGSINYVRTFYNAMIIFAQKHFKGRRSWIMVKILKGGIYFAAAAKFLVGTFKNLLPVILDCCLLILSIVLSKELWEQYYFKNPSYFQDTFYTHNLPIYIGIWMLALWLKGVYYSWKKQFPFIVGSIWGMIGVLIVYALLPGHLRSSRIVLLLSTILFLSLGLLARLIANRNNRTNIQKKILLVGDTLNIERTKEVINRAAPSTKVIGALSVKNEYDPARYINHVSAIEDVSNVYQPDEIIFSAEDVEFGEMTRLMSKLGAQYEYKIASYGSELIVGSTSKNESGEWYGIQIAFQIDKPISKRNKRLIDVSICLLLAIVFPLTLVLNRQWRKLVNNWYCVLISKKTWFGYDNRDSLLDELPSIKSAVVNVNANSHLEIPMSLIHNRNYLYAKDYTVWQDLEGALKNFNRLGN